MRWQSMYVSSSNLQWCLLVSEAILVGDLHVSSNITNWRCQYAVFRLLTTEVPAQIYRIAGNWLRF